MAGQQVQVNGKELMSHANPYFISPTFTFIAYPNQDSTLFKEWYNIPKVETCVRGMLRYQGFPEFIRALVKFSGEPLLLSLILFY